jgi:hypothetical protein
MRTTKRAWGARGFRHMIDWKIQSRARACQACARPFVEKQLYYTLLLDKRNILERLDVCAACWEAQYADGAHDRKGFLSFWHGVYNAPTPPPAEAIRKESAETLLRKLVQSGDPAYGPACFILAVMLERKRILRVKAQATLDGRRQIVYEHPKEGDLFQITDPNLQLQQLEVIQRQVADLLEHGLPDSGEIPPAAAVEQTPSEAPSDQTPATAPDAADQQTPAATVGQAPEVAPETAVAQTPPPSA